MSDIIRYDIRKKIVMMVTVWISSATSDLLLILKNLFC